MPAHGYGLGDNIGSITEFARWLQVKDKDAADILKAHPELWRELPTGQKRIPVWWASKVLGLSPSGEGEIPTTREAPRMPVFGKAG